jgi:tetratricopeptide (TPR) repeat protein
MLRRLLLALLLVALALLALPSLTSTVVANLALAALLKSPVCASNDAPCHLGRDAYPSDVRGQGGHTLDWVRDQLTLATKYAPGNETLKLRMAELEFVDGNGDEAARLLPHITLREPTGQAEWNSNLPHSRLLLPGTYENYLLAAHQLAAEQNWTASVEAFRWALSLGSAYMLPSDHKAYFNALAEHYAQQSEQQAASADAAFLAGKYFARSGQYIKARQWLISAQNLPSWSELSRTDQAGDWTYLANILEETIDLEGARAAYEKAIDISPVAKEPRIGLIKLLHQLGVLRVADQVADGLVRLGPTYRLGKFSTDYAVPAPGTLASGWSLVGYDVNGESLDTGGQLDLWLWWKGPSEAPSVQGDWLSIGEYWLQHQSVVNLVPNGGFEWGNTSSELPVGFHRSWDFDHEAVSVTAGLGPSQSTQLLRLPNALVGLGPSIQTAFFPIDTHAVYLAAMWFKREPQSQIAARLWCSLGIPYSGFAISEEPANNTDQLWIHATYFGLATTDPKAGQCGMRLYGAYGKAEWDQVLVVRLESTP